MDLVATEITTERLILTPLTTADLPAIFNIAQHKESIEDFQYAAETIDDVKKWLEPALTDPLNLVWVIRKNGRAIGLFDLYLEAEYSDIAENICRVGYFLDNNEHNQGFATEALHGVIDWVFTNTTITRIESGVTLHNAPSYRVLEKAGFVFDKVIMQNWEWRGQTYDSAYYYLLKPELQKSD